MRSAIARSPGSEAARRWAGRVALAPLRGRVVGGPAGQAGDDRGHGAPATRLAAGAALPPRRRARRRARRPQRDPGHLAVPRAARPREGPPCVRGRAGAARDRGGEAHRLGIDAGAARPLSGPSGRRQAAGGRGEPRPRPAQDPQRSRDLFPCFLAERSISPPETNVEVPTPRRIYDVDCLWRAERVALELDGRATHDTRRGFFRDREKLRALTAAGLRAVAVTSRDIGDDALEREIRTLLALGANATG